MTIGLDARFAEGKPTGVGKYIQALALGLAAHHFRVILFYSQKPQLPIRGEGIKSIILPANKYLWEQIYLPRALKKEKAALYHATGNLGVPLFANIPAVLTVHDLIPLLQKDYFNQAKIPALSKKLYFWRARTSIGKAKKIISDTHWTKKAIINLFKTSPNKINVIYLDSPLPKEIDEKAYLRFGLEKNQYIINNGGVDQRKNISSLIAAFTLLQKELPFLRLVITGENQRLIPSLKQIVKNQQLTEKIIFTGFLEESALWGLLKNAFCLCYPTLAEGFGLPLIEAFRAKTPVVTSNLPVLKEVGDNACLFINPNRPKAIAQAIIKLQDKNLRQKLTAAGQKQAQKFSQEKTIIETIKVYQEIY
ncbi:glycosyltransferase family 4 protein [Candidatus Shapirobacteria bacterium]|nr:glycosyltransferase family 4 protein [Candidatus Shapirobacteria bacterium]